MLFSGKVNNNTEGNFDYFIKFYAETWDDAESTGLTNLGQLISTIPADSKNNHKPIWNKEITYNQKRKLI